MSVSHRINQEKRPAGGQTTGVLTYQEQTPNLNHPLASQESLQT